MASIPKALITEAESKAAEFHLARICADRGSPPMNWDSSHPCEFGVFQKGRDRYAVAPLFPHVIANMRQSGFRCVYQTA